MMAIWRTSAGLAGRCGYRGACWLFASGERISRGIDVSTAVGVSVNHHVCQLYEALAAGR
jgi:hypothetical protein